MTLSQTLRDLRNWKPCHTFLACLRKWILIFYSRTIDSLNSEVFNIYNLVCLIVVTYRSPQGSRHYCSNCVSCLWSRETNCHSRHSLKELEFSIKSEGWFICAASNLSDTHCRQCFQLLFLSRCRWFYWCHALSN